MQVGRDRAALQDAAGGLRDEPATQPAASGGGVDHDSQLVAEPVVPLDTDPAEVAAVGVPGEQHLAAEGTQPRRGVGGFATDPKSGVGQVGRFQRPAEHGEIGAALRRAQQSRQPGQQARPFLGGGGLPDSLGGGGPHRQQRPGVRGSDAERRVKGAVPARHVALRGGDDLQRLAWRPGPQPVGQVCLQPVRCRMRGQGRCEHCDGPFGCGDGRDAAPGRTGLALLAWRTSVPGPCVVCSEPFKGSSSGSQGGV